MTKTALITGITGQDGSYLARFLLDKNYKVFGTYRRLSTPNFWRLQSLDAYENVELIPADLNDIGSLSAALQIANPDEVYNLAAQSFVGTSFEQPIGTAETTGLGVTRVLEAIRMSELPVRFYQASTSELFGRGDATVQTEFTPFVPASPYAAAKLYGHWMTKIYRDGYGLFASTGILFNHESPLRGLEFVTRKITNAVARISLGLQDTLELGNLQASRDWGYAPEYVEAMWLTLQQESADDYVIATNESHTVEEFVSRAFETVGLPWEKYVRVSDHFRRPLEVEYLKGSYKKASECLGWKPRVAFNELVNIMVAEDVSRWKRWSAGEQFAWDAPNYPDESRIIPRTLGLDR